MATGGSDGSVRVYEEDDKVDEKLLNQLSKWILYNRLPWLARNLGFTQAEIVRVMMQFQTAEEQIFQVNNIAFMNNKLKVTSEDVQVCAGWRMPQEVFLCPDWQQLRCTLSLCV